MRKLNPCKRDLVNMGGMRCKIDSIEGVLRVVLPPIGWGNMDTEEERLKFAKLYLSTNSMYGEVVRIPFRDVIFPNDGHRKLIDLGLRSPHSWDSYLAIGNFKLLKDN